MKAQFGTRRQIGLFYGFLCFHRVMDIIPTTVLQKVLQMWTFADHC